MVESSALAPTVKFKARGVYFFNALDDQIASTLLDDERRALAEAGPRRGAAGTAPSGCPDITRLSGWEVALC